MQNKAEGQQGFLKGEAFSLWISRHKLKVSQVARMFDVSQATVWRWQKRGAPKLVYWACKAYDSGVRPPWLGEDLKPPMKKGDKRKGNVPPHVRAAMAAAEAAKSRFRPRHVHTQTTIDPIYDD